MNYYDNGPFLKSLENGSSASNNTALIVGLLVGLAIISGIAIIQGNQLKKGKTQFAELQKKMDAVKAENKELQTARSNTVGTRTGSLPGPLTEEGTIS